MTRSDDTEGSGGSSTLRNVEAQDRLRLHSQGAAGRHLQKRRAGHDLPSLDEIQKYCAQQIDTLWDEVKRFDNPHTYYVDLSQKLWDIKYDLLKTTADDARKKRADRALRRAGRAGGGADAARGIFPGATYCAPLLASLVLIPAQEECGTRAAWGLFTAAALLSLLLCADKEAALLFAALGYYPILKARFDAVRPGLLSRLCKLAFFNAAVLAAYAVLLFVLVSDTARAEFREMGKAMTAALLLGGNIVFLL